MDAEAGLNDGGGGGGGDGGGGGASASVWRRVDDVVARVERGAILACVAVMTVLVGADVTQRTMSRPVGKTEEIVGFITSGALDEHTRHLVADAVFHLLALVFFVAAAHASRQVKAERNKGAPPKLLGSFVVGFAVNLAVSLGVWALLTAFPSSVPGAQKFALGLMLWAGMLGASVATRERRHIVLDAVTKKLDDKAKRPFALAGGVVAGAFCAVIAALGFMQLGGEVGAWAENHNVGVYESLPIPTWTTTLAIPVAFALMAVRFVGYGVRDFIHGPPALLSEGVDLEALAKEGRAVE